ncbi:LysM peptidoglycan-binding domain-containing protein [Mesobacillus zeae]|uniref:LysM peptidoglycan-binding domain-containing protein n=1 Tax=Mesobacillus zeae TaxID=1917180 RepID=A0A398BIW8_9BACI|nr:LysM peptidoglycan-binding domain-containing protein [Mesobacillus zeae]RID87323.1 LysM peptidoglycan-binding domain-containing protein [Mesobacillus zeae]
MNKEAPYRDQAERLRKKIDRTKKPETESLNALPPRNRHHDPKKHKVKFKLKYPVIRMLVLFFILLIVSIISANTYLSGKEGRPDDVPANSGGFEDIRLENKETPKNAEDSKEDESRDGMGSSNSEDAADSTGYAPVETEMASSLTQDPAENKEDSSGQKKNIYHTVKPSETLFLIAMQYYHSEQGIGYIREANKLQTDEIYAGQVLVIPVQEE